MKIVRFLAPLLLCICSACHHHNDQQPTTTDPVGTTPVYTQPEQPTTQIPVSEPATTNAEDEAIIDAVLVNEDTRDTGSGDRAVVFGNNYSGTQAQLHECVGDAKKNVLNLVRVEKFDPKNIRLFLDIDKCTKANYEKWVTWVVADTKPGDRRFFASSSHGAEDTNEQGQIVDVLVTSDMILKNEWSSATEVSPEFWAKVLRSTTVNFLFLNDSCHAGGQMRHEVGLAALKNKRLVRSLDGPPAVQARLNAATQRGPSLRALALTGTVVWACQPSELSEEDSVHGGLGTDAYWKARKSMIATNPKVGDIIREANRILHTEYAASQHEGLTGQNKPVFSKD